MKTAILSLFLALTAFSATGIDTEIRAREKAWASAAAAGDLAALDKIYSDDLVYAHSTGAVESKTEYMNRLKTGKQKYDHVTHEKILVFPHGDTVVTHLILRMDGLRNGERFNDHLMALHVWCKQAGEWRLVAHQTSKLPN